MQLAPIKNKVKALGQHRRVLLPVAALSAAIGSNFLLPRAAFATAPTASDAAVAVGQLTDSATALGGSAYTIVTGIVIASFLGVAAFFIYRRLRGR